VTVPDVEVKVQGGGVLGGLASVTTIEEVGAVAADVAVGGGRAARQRLGRGWTAGGAGGATQRWTRKKHVTGKEHDRRARSTTSTEG
jgi:hypothetical protein